MAKLLTERRYYYLNALLVAAMWVVVAHGWRNNPAFNTHAEAFLAITTFGTLIAILFSLVVWRKERRKEAGDG